MQQRNETVKESDVLFQKLGNTWYVFTEVDSKMYYSALPDGLDPRSTKLELHEVIQDHMKKVAKNYKRLESQAA
jgi:hypothetical protein